MAWAGTTRRGQRLQKGRSNVEGFKFTALSKQQLMEGLAGAIHRREITYPDGPIVHEFEAFQYEYTPSGVRYAAPAGMHDDCVCALALACGFMRHRYAGPFGRPRARPAFTLLRLRAAAWRPEP
jgi:hypothetical protein